MNNKFLIILVGLSSVLFGEAVYKVYNVEKAEIHYDISGDTEVTQNTHINIIGSASLVFVNWGVKRIYKENYTKTSTGTIENMQDIQNITFDDYGVIYNVNFDKNIIEKREDPIIKQDIKDKKNVSSKSTENWEKVGTSNILGYKCQEFQHKKTKKCIYKGIVLKEEVNLDNMLVIKEASSISFDENITDEYFELPTFKKSISKGFLFDKIEILHQDKTDIFKKQKKFLPKLLREMQEARVCLENAEDINEANICLDNVIKIKSKINGIEDNGCEVSSWRKKQKEEKLDTLDAKILKLKQEMPCIRRSRNIDDLVECMKYEII